VGADPDRERKRSPHRCECGSSFDVCYFDDRRDTTRDADPVTVQVACPACNRSKTLAVPHGSERTIVVESSAFAEEDDGDEGYAG
jgi:hypothetical protein